jgi:hypothetical protein
MSIQTFDLSLPEYAAPCERPVVQTLIDLLLREGGVVSVYDEEDVAIHKSNDKAEILKSMSQTGWDTVESYHHDGDLRGWFSLIYNNGSNNEPMIVISDYSANDWTENVYRKLDEAFGGYEL